MSLKRNFNTENTIFAPNKKQKFANVLSTTNDLGLLSPPVSPENIGKSINISNIALKSVSKNLQASLGSSSSNEISPYTKAKRLFLRSSNPYSSSSDFVLKGREREAQILNSYFVDSIKNLNSSSIYISGPPGTGKSAQTNATIDKLVANSTKISEAKKIYHVNSIDGCMINKTIKIIKFNCMSLNNPENLFKELYYVMTGCKNSNSNISSSELFQCFTKLQNTDYDMTILILDEMDNIVNKSQQLLFELFTWASNLIDVKERPNLLLIGIANALNLTDRFLPRLRSNCISPKIIQFLPYTSDQIKSVITNKLLSLTHNKNDKENDKENQIHNISGLPPLVHPAAIQYCAKKSAVTTGDLRKSFDLMFKSIDLFEQNLLKMKSLDEINNTELNKLPKMMISQVVKVCSDSFNANFDTRIKPLTIQQKMLLLLLFRFEEKNETELNQIIKLKSKSQSNTINKNLDSFFKYYVDKSKLLDNVLTLKRNEFLELITFLDSHGLLVISMLNTSSSTKELLSNNVASLNFDNYKVSTNIPKFEFFKNINEIDILRKIISSKY